MDIEQALAIDGWMTNEELQWLATQSSKARIVVEIGSYLGRSTRAMADNLRPHGTLFAIDTWNGSPNEMDAHKACAYMDGDHVYWNFCNNLWNPIACGSVIPLRMHSHNAIDLLYDNGLSPNFIFIDGCHDYAAVKNDIETFREILAPGGVLSGHDYFEDWPEVVQAVNDCCPKVERPEGTRIWREVT